MRIRVLGPDKSFIHRDVSLLRDLGHDAVWVSFESLRDVARESLFRRELTIHWLCGFGAGQWARLPPIIRGKTVGVFGGGEVHPDNLKDPSFALNIRRVLTRFDGITFVAPHLVELAARQGLPIPRNIAVSPTYANPEVFRPSEKRPKTAAMCGPFLTPARILHKGLDRLPSIARENPDWTFFVVGLAPYLTDVIKRLKNVVPLSPEPENLTAEQRWSRLASETEVFLCLSRWEGLPNTLIEAMLSGCVPVVTKDVPSVPWAVGATGTVLGDNISIDLDAARGDGGAARARARRLFSKRQRMDMWTRLTDRAFAAEAV